MNRYISFCINYPKTAILILTLFTALLAPGILFLEIDNSIETLMPKHDSQYIYYNKVKETFGDNGQFVVMAVSAENLFSHDTLSELDRLISDLEEYKDFDKDREASRLKRLAKFIGKDPVPARDILSAFDDDPVFQRVIKRKMDGLYEGREILTPRHLRKLEKAIYKSHVLKEAGVLDDIISPFTAKDIKGENDALEIYDLIDRDDAGNRMVPETPEEIRTFRDRLFRNPVFEDVLYSGNRNTGDISDFGILLKFRDLEDRDPATRDILEIIGSHTGLHVVFTGMPVVYVRAVDYIHMDHMILVPIVMLVVMLVFYFNFRSFRGVWLPLVCLGMAEAWVLGIMGYLGFRITIMGSSLPPLMIAIGSSYAIHILNQYYNDFDLITERGRKEGLFLSMTHISLTVLLTGLTTFIAFVTLCTSQLSAVKEWGIFCGIGALFAVFIASAMIPAALSLLPHRFPASLRARQEKQAKTKTTLTDRMLQFFSWCAVVHYKKVVFIVALFVIVSIAGILRLKVDTAYVSYFKKDSQVRQGVNVIGEKFGGGWGFDILLDSGQPDGVKSPEFLKFMESFREWLTSEENADLKIGRTDAFSDIIKTMNMAMNDDDESAYAIPESAADIADYLEIYAGDDTDSDGRFDEFEPFVDIDYQTCDLLARLCRKEGQLVGTTEVRQIVKKIRTYLTENIPEGASFQITGFPMMEVQVSHYLVMGQLQTLVLSLVIVDIISILLFQHFAAGLLALIPMGLAVLINFGVMGWFRIALDMSTSVIAAVTIGIGIDDTIHFMNNFRHNRARGFSIDESIERTLAVAGKAIIFTSLALIFGFLVFLLSRFIPMNLLGILLSITMVATTVSALVVLPAFIKITKVSLSPPKKDTWVARNLNLSRWFGLDEIE